jgi:hypothetical protein
MPKLGQAIETPGGLGQVISMQLLKELVTVRLDEQEVEVTFRCDELGLAGASHQPTDIVEEVKPGLVPAEEEIGDLVAAEVDEEVASAEGRRRRRRRGRRGNPAS